MQGEAGRESAKERKGLCVAHADRGWLRSWWWWQQALPQYGQPLRHATSSAPLGAHKLTTVGAASCPVSHHSVHSGQSVHALQACLRLRLLARLHARHQRRQHVLLLAAAAPRAAAVADEGDVHALQSRSWRRVT